MKLEKIQAFYAKRSAGSKIQDQIMRKINGGKQRIGMVNELYPMIFLAQPNSTESSVVSGWSGPINNSRHIMTASVGVCR